MRRFTFPTPPPPPLPFRQVIPASRAGPTPTHSSGEPSSQRVIALRAKLEIDSVAWQVTQRNRVTGRERHVAIVSIIARNVTWVAEIAQNCHPCTTASVCVPVSALCSAANERGSSGLSRGENEK